MPVVIDASTTIAWLFDEIDLLNRIDDLLEDDVVIAPPLWQLEVTQAVLKRERRRLITSDAGDELLNVLDLLPITVTAPAPRALRELASFARPHQLTTYDATYLLLAIDEQARLMTFDNNLRLAATRLRIEVVD